MKKNVKQIELSASNESGIKVEAKKEGLEIWGWYDHVVGLEGGLITWEQIDEMRRIVMKSARRCKQE